MNYHVGRASQQLGVFSEETIRAKLASGELRADDLGWREGMAQWQALGALFPSLTSSSPIGVPPPIAGGGWAGAGLPPPRPGNNLVPAILVTLFCCLPLGIPSIIFAAQVDGKYAAGDYAGAEASAKKSKTWMWWALGVGLVGGVLYFGLAFAAALSGAAGGPAGL